jgi:hypothetical protein
MNEEQEEELTEADMEDVVDMLDEDDLRERSQKLDEAQELYEEIAYLANPKMPCPECSGAGSISSGSLGSSCPRCFGQRVVDRPDSEPIEMPPFKQLRASISTYGLALADRALPAMREDGTPHPGKKNLGLPPVCTVPTLAEIQALYDEGKVKAKALAPAPEMAEQLAEPQSPKGLLSDGGELDDYTDAELDDMEDTLDEGITKGEKK